MTSGVNKIFLLKNPNVDDDFLEVFKYVLHTERESRVKCNMINF